MSGCVVGVNTGEANAAATVNSIVILSSGLTPLLAVIVAVAVAYNPVNVPVIAPVVALIWSPGGKSVADHVGAGVARGVHVNRGENIANPVGLSRESSSCDLGR